MRTDKGKVADISSCRPRRNPKANLAKIREYMDQHYNESLSIRQLAQMANISPKYFVDLFKKTYGQSAMDCNPAVLHLATGGFRTGSIGRRAGCDQGAQPYTSRPTGCAPGPI